MKKRVILVQPNIGSWDDNIIRKKFKIPLSLLCVSRYLVDEYDVVIIDQRIDKKWKKTLNRELALKPICVGTTSLTGEQIKHALDISKYVKRNSNIPIVWGGIHASIMPEQTIKNRNIDIVVKGEGEVTFYELVKALDMGQSLANIPGLLYKKDGDIFQNPDRELADLNQFPPVPYELIDMYAYTSDLSIESSRGCPFRCNYCYNATFNRSKWRSLSAENVIKEIKRLHSNYRFSNIVFIDDNFFVNLDRVKTILKAMVDEHLCSSWGCSGMRIDTISRMDESFIKLLKESGCYSIETGVESCSDRVLNIINKGITKQNILDLNKRFSRYQIELSCNFVIGFPGETIEDLKETTQSIVQMSKDNAHMRISFVAIYQPYPGTQLYSECVKLGLHEPQCLQEWISCSWEEEANWRPQKLNLLLNSINSTGYSLRFNKNNLPSILPFGMTALLARQVALFRFKHFFFNLMLENQVKRFINKTTAVSIGKMLFF